MADDRGPAIEPEDLERLLRAVDPNVLMVNTRVLRRVIRRDRDLTGIGFRVPHRKSYVIAGSTLLEIAEPDELGLRPDEPPPEVAILLVRPDREELADLSRAEALVESWRLLFHARIHVALDEQSRQGRLKAADLRARIDRIGQAEFDEARSVLRQDDYLLPPRDDLNIYIEFTSVYLELRYFADHLIPRTFPAIRDPGRIDRILADDVDAEKLFDATRPRGAPRVIAPKETECDDPGPSPEDEEPPPNARRPSETRASRLMLRADRGSARGNSVRAAIERARASRVAPAGSIGRTRDGARRELDRLAERLGKALGLDQDGVRAWRRALPPLLPRAARGIVAVEARLLYDLQNVCLDHEREVSKVDLVEWVLSFGKRPVRRPLPDLREVLICKHLRSAIRRLSRSRLSDQARYRLDPLLREALHAAERRLRDQFRPTITDALESNGMVPRNLPERVARRKLVEELLDRVVRTGYLTMGDLRDAVSRNNLKLPDLAGPVEFLRGNRLLQADQALAVGLDGVYHRGEVYLRWLQRLSALAFGTPIGRFLTLYLVLPFGGAFVTLEGVQHLVHLIAPLIIGAEVELMNPMSFAAVGLLLLALIHFQGFRREFLTAMRLLFQALRSLVYDTPVWLLGRPWIRAILSSRTFAVLSRSLLAPGLITALTWILMPRRFREGSFDLPATVTVFLTLSLLLNSRFGRDLGESAADGASWVVHRVRIGILPALYRFIMDVFDRLLEAIDRVLYTVDEWLRFRGGQGRLALVAKALLGVVWFFVAYVVRFCVNLLIEPQINPIKHFPVVTVSHKVLMTQLPSVQHLLVAQGYGRAQAGTLAFSVLAAIPGIFGFLVWELKENWRLYEANRSTTLKPVAIGHHGETLARLLRPRFHSGTLPKLFTRLRRAERKADRTGRRRAVLNYRESLDHTAEAILHFVEREFIALLHEGASLGSAQVEAGEVEIGSNRIRIELRDPGYPEIPAWIGFEEQSGWLVAGIDQVGWIDRLDLNGRRTLASALAGLYKMAGVDLVREQVAASFEPDPPAYDIAPEGLIVWPDPSYETQAVYPLRDGPLIVPQGPSSTTSPLPTLDRARLMFRLVLIPWRRWIEVWELDRVGQGHPEPIALGMRLLPPAPLQPAGTPHS
ncbi:MAG: hypothetical protein ABI353_24450 [Isosphaeraceae bacterium]